MPSFVDYLKGGCEVSLMIAVDFTGEHDHWRFFVSLGCVFTATVLCCVAASNGDPKTQQSLHHLWPEHSGRRNDYQATIETVGGILAAYDADGLVPAFGTLPTRKTSLRSTLGSRKLGSLTLLMQFWSRVTETETENSSLICCGERMPLLLQLWKRAAETRA